jgi:hypothetical protein
MTKTRDLADLGGGFIQAGTGAVQRTVESKLQDTVSVLDFIPDMEGGNFIKQAYLYLKTLPEFADAVDC